MIDTEIHYRGCADRRLTLEQFAERTVNRITKGWAFFGQSPEEHEAEKKAILEEFYRRVQNNLQ